MWTIQIGGSGSRGKNRFQTSAAHRSAVLVNEPPSPDPGICVAIATGRSPDAVNSCRRNVTRRLARGGTG
jgi:hypothetical protein